MTPKAKIKVSKFLCLLLRHTPEAVNAQGWASTTEVLVALKAKFAGITPSVLNEIVVEDDKQRYSFSLHGELIRANQGHSIPVDLGLVAVAPPEYLFHGTARKTLWLIRRDGLLPMDRQYVHLSSSLDTARLVGKRHGDPIVLTVLAEKMSEKHTFYRSENGVWLTIAVPIEFLHFEEDDAERADHL